MVTDPIADFITRIKNASMVNKETVTMPYSKLKHAIAERLKKEGFITDAIQEGKDVEAQLIVTLAYDDRGAKITGMERISSPGRRLYTKAKDLKPFRQGHGAVLLTTPEGIITDSEARKNNTGGEILMRVW